ncbi:unnamed protein product [Penicillium glandicola]
MTVRVSPIDYDQPLSSAYEAPIITARIGYKEYTIPEHCLRKCPKFGQKAVLPSRMSLSDIDGDVAHTFVHCLYTGSYQTLSTPLSEGTSSVEREYKRSLQAYQASRTYKFPELEAHAVNYIERFGQEMPVPDILRAVREVWSNLPTDETWLPNYLQRNLQQSLMSSTRSDLVLDEIYNALGQDHKFDNSVTRLMLEILLSPQGDDLRDGASHDGNTHNHADEEGTISMCGSLDSTWDDECHSKEVSEVETPILDEPVPIDDEPMPAEIQLTPVEDEPIHFEYNSAPVEDECAPTEDEPVPAEDKPIPFKYEYKDLTPYKYEPIAYEYRPIHFNYKSAPIEDEGTPAEDEPVPEDEPAPAEDEPVPEDEPAPAEDEPAPAEDPLASRPMIQMTLEDLALYEDWKSISPKNMSKRKKILKKKNLPIPNRYGQFPTSI